MNLILLYVVLRDDAIALNGVFGGHIDGVFELLDDDCVTVLKGHSSKRMVMRVESTTGSETYYVPAGDSFCQCLAYQRANKLCNYVEKYLTIYLIMMRSLSYMERGWFVGIRMID
jgi:hypothetical protein